LRASLPKVSSWPHLSKRACLYNSTYNFPDLQSGNCRAKDRCGEAQKHPIYKDLQQHKIWQIWASSGIGRPQPKLVVFGQGWDCVRRVQ
jgi:hypothetical protein